MDVHTRIAKAKIFIDDNYDRDLDLDKLCAEACFSKFHFIRLFKRSYCRTPYQYLTERRIEKAKERLALGNATVSEVCFDVGFESAPSFALKFKSITGETPAVFRLRMMQTRALAKLQPRRFIPSCFSIMHCAEE
ncbi:MAG: helix-turn-helix transcriptional regulator [Bacteroidia bacterium]|nr:helix-turn-helix transcriptional regulator [Bacteroidia bacterium]